MNIPSVEQTPLEHTSAYSDESTAQELVGVVSKKNKVEPELVQKALGTNSHSVAAETIERRWSEKKYKTIQDISITLLQATSLQLTDIVQSIISYTIEHDNVELAHQILKICPYKISWSLALDAKAYHVCKCVIFHYIDQALFYDYHQAVLLLIQVIQKQQKLDFTQAVIDYIIEKNINFETVTAPFSPIVCALSLKLEDIALYMAKKLIEHGIDLTYSQTWHSLPILVTAIEHGCTTFIQNFIECLDRYEIDWNRPYFENMTPLLYAMHCSSHNDTVDILLAEALQKKSCCVCDFNAQLYAAALNQALYSKKRSNAIISYIDAFAMKGYDFAATDFSQMHPLCAAIATHSSKVALYLIKKMISFGVALNTIQGFFVHTLLHTAIHYREYRVAEELIEGIVQQQISHIAEKNTCTEIFSKSCPDYMGTNASAADASINIIQKIIKKLFYYREIISLGEIVELTIDNENSIIWIIKHCSSRFVYEIIDIIVAAENEDGSAFFTSEDVIFFLEIAIQEYKSDIAKYIFQKLISYEFYKLNSRDFSKITPCLVLGIHAEEHALSNTMFFSLWQNSEYRRITCEEIGKILFHSAISYNMNDIALLLIDHMYDNNEDILCSTLSEGKSSIHIAASCNNLLMLHEIFSCIQKNQRDFLYFDNNGYTPLHDAILSAQTDSLLFLLSQYKDTWKNRHDSKAILNSCLCLALEQKNSSHICEIVVAYMIQLSYSLNEYDASGSHIVCKAIQSHQTQSAITIICELEKQGVECSTLLLQKEESISSSSDSSGSSIIACAMQSENIQLCKFMLSKLKESAKFSEYAPSLLQMAFYYMMEEIAEAIVIAMQELKHPVSEHQIDITPIIVISIQHNWQRLAKILIQDIIEKCKEKNQDSVSHHFLLSSVLKSAIEAYNKDLLKFTIDLLLESKKENHLVDENHNTLLHYCMGADLKNFLMYERSLEELSKLEEIAFLLVNTLITNKREYNPRNRDGTTILHIALKNKFTQVSTLILEQLIHDAKEYNPQDNRGVTPFHIAVETNTTFLAYRIFNELKKRNEESNPKDNLGKTPLHIGIETNHCCNISEEIIDHLLFSKKECNPITYDKISAFHIACYKKNDALIEKYIKALSRLSQEINPSSCTLTTPLHILCQTENEVAACAVIKELIRQKKEINTADNLGKTPLHFACISTLREVINTIVHDLYQRGHNVNPADNSGNTPFHIICQVGNHAICLWMLSVIQTKKGDYAPKNKQGDTPLHLLVKRDLLNEVSASLITLFIQKNSLDLNTKNIYGQTPLFIAAKTANTYIVEQLSSYLLEKCKKSDLDYNIQTTNGERISDYVLRHSSPTTAQHFFKNFPKIAAVMQSVRPNELLQTLLKNQKFLLENKCEVVLFSAFIQSSIFTNELRLKLTDRVYSATAGELVQTYPHLSLLDFATINVKKLEDILLHTILPAPQNVYLYDLMQLFDEINFTDPSNKATYINPSFIKDDTNNLVSPEMLRIYLHAFISNIFNQTPFFGTPSAEDTPQLQKYYLSLEKIVLHIIAKLQNEKDIVSRSKYVIDLAIAGNYCGGRYIAEAMSIYHLIVEGAIELESSSSSSSSSDASNKDLLARLLKNSIVLLQQKTIQDIMGADERDSHQYNLITAALGKERVLHGADDVIDSLHSSSTRQEKWALRLKYDRICTPKALLNTIIQQIHEASNKKHDKEINWQDFLVDWFKAHIPDEWKQTLYNDIHKYTNVLLEKKTPFQEIKEYLLGSSFDIREKLGGILETMPEVNIYLPSIANPFPIIEQARVQDAIQCGIEAWEKVCSKEHYLKICSDLNEIKNQKQALIGKITEEICHMDIKKQKAHEAIYTHSLEDSNESQRQEQDIEKQIATLTLHEEKTHIKTSLENHISISKQEEYIQYQHSIEQKLQQGIDIVQASQEVLPNEFSGHFCMLYTTRLRRVLEEEANYIQQHVPISWKQEEYTKITKNVALLHSSQATFDDLKKIASYLQQHNIAYSVPMPCVAIENHRIESYLLEHVYKSENDPSFHTSWITPQAIETFLFSEKVII